jgi:serine/threonine protein kinase
VSTLSRRHSAWCEGWRLALPEVVRTAACVADTLGTAHEAGLTHRDIKASNIIVRSSGKATVVDFGIAKSSDARHDITTTGDPGPVRLRHVFDEARHPVTRLGEAPVDGVEVPTVK